MLEKKISTVLVGRGEIFKMFALAESLGLPILLLGPPGVGKTACAKDYSKAVLQNEKDSGPMKTFILQVNGSTRASEVKGHINLKSLLAENEYTLSGGADQAEIVVIDEIDKGSSPLQNALLSVMNEKVMFNGEKEVPCNWKLFIATCNALPQSTDSPHFWDRFILQTTIDRLSNDDIVVYLNKGGTSNVRSEIVRIPTVDEINAVTIPPSYQEKLISLLKSDSTASDRTIIKAPTIAKAVHLIWGVDIAKALVKTVTMIGKERGKQMATKLQSQLQSKEVASIISKLEIASRVSTYDEFTKHINEIMDLVTDLEMNGRITAVEKEEIAQAITRTQKTSVFYNGEAEDTGTTDSDQAAMASAASISATTTNTTTYTAGSPSSGRP